MKSECSDFAPIFIGGAGRSGTTLLRAILTQNPGFCGTNEFKVLPEISSLRDKFRNLGLASESYCLDDAKIDAAFRHFIFNIFNPYLEKNPQKRFVEKTPHNIFSAEFLLNLFPKSQFIHIIRDGRDVASSLITMDWVGGPGRKVWYCESIAGAAKYWNDIIELSKKLEQNSTYKGRYIKVHYESLVMNPEKAMKGIVSWLGSTFDASALNTEQRAEKMQNEIIEQSTAAVSQKINTQGIGRWKKSMSKREKQTFHEIAGKNLINLGYTKNSGWAKR